MLLCALDGIALHCRSRSGCVVRYLSQKPQKNNTKNFETKDEKELSKVKITLKDQSGHILGIKSMTESKLLAHKLKLNLIEDKSETKHKYQSFRLVSNKQLAQMDDQLSDNQLPSDDTNDLKKNESIHSKGVKEMKRLVFSTKVDENDLLTKINATKRWTSRGHHISIHVTNPQKDPKLLEAIYTKFETQLKGFAKLNQKKIKTDNTMKFMIIPDDIQDQLRGDRSETHVSADQDIDGIDPNKLLSDEFEQQLQDIDKNLPSVEWGLQIRPDAGLLRAGCGSSNSIERRH
ncbi:unnamed protein product [Medioppia subpectinata]|uniref:Translation initiation factor 3 N-terminal domain-containing protein n=1 Tax=Medioppia subpectinata TaxID=1979941 RepID=A0A7R9KP38_9ACAR|nr:unnamed protein product [Medioppia subpectinata]CAG2107195.1 unnamed protein product [Medioppia subpectinata]